MNSRWFSKFKKNPYFVRRMAVLGCAVAIATLVTQDAHSAGPFQRLRRSFNSVRPGWIIPLPSESSESSGGDENQPTPAKQKQLKAKTKAKAKTKTDERTPTEAKPKPKKLDAKAVEKKEWKERGDELDVASGTDWEKLEPITTQPLPLRPEQLEAPTDVGMEPSETNSSETDLGLGETGQRPPVAPETFGAKTEEQDGRLAIVEIEPNGVAAAAGLRVGDMIQKVGGISIDGADSLESITDGLGNGDIVVFELLRAKKEVSREVQFGTYRGKVPSVGNDVPTPLQRELAPSKSTGPKLVSPKPSVESELTQPLPPVSSKLKLPQLQSILNRDAPKSIELRKAKLEVAPQELLDLVPPEVSATPTETESLDELLDLTAVESK